MAIEFFKTLYSSGITWSQKNFTISKETSDTISTIAQETLTCLGYGLVGATAAAAFVYYPIDATAIVATTGFVYWILQDECRALFEKIFGKPKDPDNTTGPSLGFFERWFPKPVFIQGQPPCLSNNTHTACFMNAPFQSILNDPPLKKSLQVSTTLWNDRYQALDTLCSYLSNQERALALHSHNEHVAPTTSIIPSVLSLFAHEDFAAIRTYLLKNLPYFKIPFEQLVSKIHNKEPFDPQDVFYDEAENQKILDFCLNNQELRQLILDANPQIKEKQQALLSLSKILERCEKYENSCDRPSDTIDLESLRPLLLQGLREGQQDALDFLMVLINRIVDSGIPCPYFFKIVHEKHYTKKEMPADEKANYLSVIRDPSSIGANDIIKTEETTCQLILKPKEKNNPSGQKLIDQSLSLCSVDERSEPGIFIDPQNAVDIYQPTHEKLSFPKLPEKFILSLARGIDRQKNTAVVTIPEQLQIQGKTYHMHSAGLHRGGSWGGHYLSLVRKIHNGNISWWECDDDSITKASSDTIKNFLTQGSFYFFTCQS